ncbi:MAG: arylamine N-acetyltransferase family protein [Actinomadura sp.]
MSAYLARIGTTAPVRTGVEALRELQLRHLRTVPFENLSVHRDEDIVLEETALVRKVVERRRGGFCYELNGAFATLLSALGYDVTLYAARVYSGDDLGPPFDHLCLRVEAADPWLVDVGFGSFSHHPLRLDDRADQPDPAGTFRVVDAGNGDLDVLQDGRPQYRIEPRPRALSDFEPTCWWQRTSPKSHFTRSLICTLLTETGRISLSDHTLIRTTGADRDEELLIDDADVLAAYKDHFGITLVSIPTLRTPVRH